MVESGKWDAAEAQLKAAIATFEAGHRGLRVHAAVQLAQVLIQSKDPKVANEAIELLRKAVLREPDNATAYNTLGQAYYDKGLMPQAELARAQGLFYFGSLKQAQEFAKRAQAALKPGSPDWVKADDIINYKPER